MSFVNWMDQQPLIVKVIFSLPGIDIIWGIYRVIKGAETKSNGLLVIGILWLVLGWNILWVIDLVTTLINGKPILTDITV